MLMRPPRSRVRVDKAVQIPFYAVGAILVTEGPPRFRVHVDKAVLISVLCRWVGLVADESVGGTTYSHAHEPTLTRSP